MRRALHVGWRGAVAGATALCLAGGSCRENPTDPGPQQAADFSLPDVNPTSATFDSPVSPRDHLQRVSAWYFGHAT